MEFHIYYSYYYYYYYYFILCNKKNIFSINILLILLFLNKTLSFLSTIFRYKTF